MVNYHFKFLGLAYISFVFEIFNFGMERIFSDYRAEDQTPLVDDDVKRNQAY